MSVLPVSGPRPVSAAGADLVVRPHHFDRLGRPAAAANDHSCAALEQALTWNVFRALELLPPAFWLRRLRARLQDTNLGVPAPTVARVSLWQRLPPSPTQALDHGTKPVRVDALVETEFTVWTMLARLGRDVDEAHDGHLDAIARAIDAGSWYAGAREYCFGLIVDDPAHAPAAVARVRHYGRHRAFVVNRLAPRADGLRNLGAIGVARWRDLREILEDCAVSDALDAMQRSAARQALEWLNTSTGL